MSSAEAGEGLARLHPGLLQLIRSKGWKGLQPVQRAAMPVILDGHDAVIQAPTAGGKTEAVLFPSLTRVAAEPRGRGVGVRILYLAPLRALLNDLERRAKEYAEACGLHSFKWHGDVDSKSKVAELRDPPELLLTTPESLEATLLLRPERSTFLASIRIVIIDEAHNFAAGDRGGHLVSLLERLGRYTETRAQRIALTATIGNPEELSRWLVGGGKEARSVSVGGERPAQDWKLLFFDGENADLDEMSHLHASLPGKRSLVFVRSRKRAEEIAKSIGNLDEGASRRLKVRTHHGSVSRYFREEAERMIRIASEDGLDAILSTATLELGIDLGELDRVFQLGSITSPSALLQRVGRTGRRPGRPQILRCLLTDSKELPVVVATVDLSLERSAESLRFPSRAFHLLAHQLLCLTVENSGIDPKAAWALLEKADCFRGIRKSEVGALIKAMVEKEYLRLVDGLIVAGDKTEKELLQQNCRRLFAVFESLPLYDVQHQRQQVGTLDAGFAATLTVPFLFVLAGHLWSADRIDHDKRTIEASPARAGLAPKWESFGGPDVPFETAQKAGETLHGPWFERPYLNESARRALEEERRQVAHLNWRRGKVLMTATGTGRLTLTTYAGDRINRALQQLLRFQCLNAKMSYREVVVTAEEKAGELRGKVEGALDLARTGSLADPSALEKELGATLRLWRFSPFAGCLPEDLHASALIEQTLDGPGLIRLLKASQA